MTTSIDLPFPPSVNNLFSNHRSSGRYPTKRYRDWQHAAGWQLAAQRPQRITGAYDVLFQVGRPDNRKRDLSNLWKAPSDLLVKHAVIDDDNLERRVVMEWADGLAGCRVVLTPVATQAEAA